MSIENIFADYIESQGWNEASQVEVLLQFLDEYGASEEDFKAFLEEQAETENISLEYEDYEDDDDDMDKFID